ncbi:peptidoglycan DD-metalloendopeptidase family protein [Mycetocola zhadangensis]|nr:peptidoglycan DD-metalloendopeptidase family protein [Mycetocola zhadangensis]
MRLRTLIATIALGVVVASMGISAPATAATSYPTWEDVQNARASESAKAAEITRIEGLIAGLRTNAENARLAAVAAADEYQTALAVAEEALIKSEDLKAQLATAQEAAATSSKQAGALFAQMGRTSTFDTTASLLINSNKADDTLYKLGAVSKLTSLSTQLLDNAEQDANQVTSLSAQGEVAATILEEARVDSEEKLEAATVAAEAAAAAVAEQEAHEETLLGQLSLLKGQTASIEEGYAAGVAERARLAAIEAERQRKLAEERAAAAAAEAAKNKPGNSGGGGGSAGGGGGGGSNAGATGTYFTPSPQGWWRPLPGAITSWYGNRPILCGGTGCSVSFHAGIDFGNACGHAVKAIQGGRVVSATNAGDFGYRIIIDHGGVTSTYGHLSAGSFRVSAGQQVSGGQVIASVGKTGVATGCHLDLKINGGTQDPAPFLRGKGVRI